MGEKRSCCCGGLPSIWWWLLTLLGLPALFYLMVSSQQGLVENDIAGRATADLQAAGMGWADARLDQRGRDLLLQGVASSEEDKAKAAALAGGVYGVREVQNLIEVASLKAPMLSLQSEGGRLLIDGVLSSQDEIDGLFRAAEASHGVGNVDNRMVVGSQMAKADWLGSLSDLLPALSGLEGAGIRLPADGGYIAGVVNSDADKAGLLDKARQLLGGKLEDQLVVNTMAAEAVAQPAGQVVEPPVAKNLLPANLMALLGEDKTLTLSGTLSSEQQVTALLAAAGKRVGADKVINQLKVSGDYADAGWLTGAQKLFGLLPDAQGKFSIGDGTLVMFGVLPDDLARNAAVSGANDALAGSGLTLVDRMVVAPPAPEPVAAAPVAPEPAAAPEAPVAPEPELSEAAKAVLGCQQQLNDTMKGQQILFETNKAIIKKDSLALLDALVQIVVTCQDVIAGGGIAVSGHTDSDGDDAYNQGLSQQRADAVKVYFVRAGVDTALIETIGYGETQPVASNDTAEGRAQNRRITFDIKHK